MKSVNYFFRLFSFTCHQHAYVLEINYFIELKETFRRKYFAWGSFGDDMCYPIRFNEFH